MLSSECWIRALEPTSTVSAGEGALARGMTPNKRSSEADGRRFLSQALAAEQQVLAKQLELSRRSITHHGSMGEVNEQLFIDVLKHYLPRRYGVEQGIVIDSDGRTSDQIDIVIYDRQYTPPLLKQMSHRYILAEAVYGVLEVKASLNKEYLVYAADKAHSVRRLTRTSVEIPHAGGVYPPKALFPILAGIVGIQAEWAAGLESASFRQALAKLCGVHTLSIGLALEDQAFSLAYNTYDLQLRHGRLDFSGPTEHSLAWFLFTLLKRLQDLGTCPAVDWLRYRNVLSV
jgi:hypothetical protein